jgi:hypothetical protein
MKRKFAWLTTAAFGVAATAYAVTRVVLWWGKHEGVSIGHAIKAVTPVGRTGSRRGRSRRARREGEAT